MKGTIVFDLDYTLIDTAWFKAELAASPTPEAVLSRMADFVFSDAGTVLKRLKDDGWKLALLTKGEPAWQERKVACAGLKDCFDYAVYTAVPKAERLDAYADWPAPLIFVNDDGPEIDALGAALPGALMLGFHGPKAKPRSPVPMFSTLEGVYAHVSQARLAEFRNS